MSWYLVGLLSFIPPGIEGEDWALRSNNDCWGVGQFPFVFELGFTVLLYIPASPCSEGVSITFGDSGSILGLVNGFWNLANPGAFPIPPSVVFKSWKLSWSLVTGEGLIVG